MKRAHASAGTCPGASLASQYLYWKFNETFQKHSVLCFYLFALELPHFNMLWSCSSVHESRSTDLTLLICVPIPLWMPEHRMQMNMPRFQLAHRGSARSIPLADLAELALERFIRLFFLQSAQLLLLSIFTSVFSVCWLCAARSATLLAGRLDIVKGLGKCASGQM